VDALRSEFDDRVAFVLADLGTNDGADLASRYGARETTLLFFSASGRQVGTLYGVQTESYLRSYIENTFGLGETATRRPTPAPSINLSGNYQGRERFITGVTVALQAYLEQSRNSVSGSYANGAGDRGIVTGTISGNWLRGRVVSNVLPGAFCEFESEISGGGASLQGTLSCNTGDQASFTMNRQ
jgi:hypothetical protein